MEAKGSIQKPEATVGETFCGVHVTRAWVQDFSESRRLFGLGLTLGQSLCLD